MTAAIRTLTPVAHADEVHLWFVDLSGPERDVSLLSADERERASRFHRAIDAHRYSGARAALRTILGAYLGRAAASLRLNTSEMGRPTLMDDRAGDLRFGLSHTGDLACLAVALGRAVGVDIEPRSDALPSPTTIRRCCSPVELGALYAMPEERRGSAFLDMWTRKEALVKATGEGFSVAPDSLCVLDDVVELGERFTLLGVAGIDGHAVSVAARGAGWRLRHFELEMCA